MSVNRFTVESALLNTGMSVKAESSRTCKGELEHRPDKASGIRLNFSLKVRSPPIAPKASFAQKISL